MLLKKSLSLFLCACLVLSLCVFALPRTAKATRGDIFYVQSTDPIPVTVTMMVLTDPAGTTPGRAQVGGGISADAVVGTAASVTLPATVTSDGNTYTVTAVGDMAFYFCNQLASVSLPEATDIGPEAFYRCEALESVSLPMAESIGDSAFYRCTALNSITIWKATAPTLGFNPNYYTIPATCTLYVPHDATGYDAQGWPSNIVRLWSVTGKVKDAAGNPVADATVRVDGTTAQTAADGTYTVYVKPGVNSAISAEKAGVGIGSILIESPSDNTTGRDIQFGHVTSVSVAPLTADVVKGGSKSFTATVAGTGSFVPTVTWSVSGGGAGTFIDSDGNLTVAANETAGASLTVTATSTADTSKSGSAGVTVVPAGYGLSIAPTSLTFGPLAAGYARPGAQTLTVTNTGNSLVMLSACPNPDPASYELLPCGNWSDPLAAGGTRTLTVQPLAGLGVGMYGCDIAVSASPGGVSATAHAQFEVTAAPNPPAPPSSGASGMATAYSGNQYSGSQSGNVWIVQADCNKLTSVVVDGVQLTREKDYTVECGSTIITFTQSCLASLKDGTHTLRAQFTDGQYSGTFTTPLSTALTTVPEPDVPATGDAPVGGALALLGLLGAVYALRRRRA